VAWGAPSGGPKKPAKQRGPSPRGHDARLLGAGEPSAGGPVLPVEVFSEPCFQDYRYALSEFRAEQNRKSVFKGRQRRLLDEKTGTGNTGIPDGVAGTFLPVQLPGC